MSEFLLKNNGALESLSCISRAAGERADYVQGGGGNTSAKLKDGLMAVKASGFRLIDVTESRGYAVIDAKTLREFYETHDVSDFADIEKECAAFAQGLIIVPSGLAALRPSVEAGFHSLLDTYVIHSHSVYANLLACVKDGESIATDALASADYNWAFVPYTDPGARLTFVIKDAMRGVQPEAIFMQNHGLIVHHHDADEALRIHADVNSRIAKMCATPYPEIVLNELGVGEYASGTTLIRDCLLSGRYSEECFTAEPLYPDQMVYLADTFSYDAQSTGDRAVADTGTGSIRYRMNGQKARAMEETIAAVLFIRENAQKLGLNVITMSEAARNFIGGWESEKYRKAMLKP